MQYLIDDIIKEIKLTRYEDIEWIGKDIFFVNTETAFTKIAKKYNLEFIDAYASLRGSYFDIAEFVIPNSYGQEDTWSEDGYQFDFCLVQKTKITIVKVNKDDINQFTIDIPKYMNFSLDELGGKRAYYLSDNFIRFRVDEQFYKTLRDENKYPEGEEDLSGPHLTFRF